MATLDTRRVHKELKKIAGTSQAIKHRLHDVLEKIEARPSSFAELRNIPPKIAEIENFLGIRKAEVTSHRHNFRLVFAHWQFADDSEHVDLLLAFPRKEGYEIDWDWVEESLQE